MLDQVQVVVGLSQLGFAKTGPSRAQLPQVRRLVDPAMTHDQSVVHSRVQTDEVADPPFEQSDSQALRIARYVRIQLYHFHFFVTVYYIVYNRFFGIGTVCPLTDAIRKVLDGKASIRVILLAHFLIKRS